MPVLSKPRGCLLLPPAPTGELGLDTKQECIPVSFSSKSRTSPGHAHWYSLARIAPRLYVPSGVQSRGGSLVGPVRPELAPLFTEGLPRRTIPVLSMTKKR